MFMPMMGLLFALLFGSAFALVLCLLIPKLRTWAPFALIPILGGAGAFVLSLALSIVAQHNDYAGAFFLGGYVVGGLLGASLGFVAAGLIARHASSLWPEEPTSRR